MNLYKKVNEWLLEYESLNNWIYFNATPYVVGTVTVNSVAGDRIKRKFINGDCEKELLFAVDMVTEYDGMGSSDVNINAMDEVINFTEWLDECEKNNNYPNFGEFNDISKIEVLTSVPTMLVDQNQGLAKYQFQVRITYLSEESEVIING